MDKYLSVFILMIPVLISGCIQPEEAFNPAVLENSSPIQDEPALEEPAKASAENYSQQETQQSTSTKFIDLCDNVTCLPGQALCQDSSVAICKNTCSEGRCSSCEPTCPPCNLTCGQCEILDSATCKCIRQTPCCGDGNCEAGETCDLDCRVELSPNACKTDSECSDNDPCTKNVCYEGSCQSNPVQECIPGDGCCPEDCSSPQDSDCPQGFTEVFNISITNIQFNPEGDDRANLSEEWVEISNLGNIDVNLQSWTLKDEKNHTYTFPGFELFQGRKLKVHVGSGTETSEDLFWGLKSPVWNNDGDTATLKDAENKTISEYRY